MNTSQHNSGVTKTCRRAAKPAGRRRCLMLLAAAAFSLVVTGQAAAQRRITKEYPAGANVRLHLKNRSGTITVETWNSNKIKVTADLESPAARFTPESSADELLIDLVRDNRGGEDVGDVNFRLLVPVNSTVDLETWRGNITVRGVQGTMVRARVSLEGDIELTGIRATTVMAESLMGNIVFDAELLRGGVYELRSMEGQISLRIAADSGFRLIAMAPKTRNIDLGGFRTMGIFQFMSENRKVVGKVGDGGAALNTTNQRGSIALMPR
ncbi:MAG: hypothetical protein H0W76_00695 [Pyrinomonadaceae bacterium]|nr:hypothetical protein [Pyrinomonadaceae bacterium]